jgi:hypothetical protein
VQASPNQASDLLGKLGITADDVLPGLIMLQGPFKVSCVLFANPFADRILKDALNLATNDGREEVQPIDLLLAIVRERGGQASDILCRLTNALANEKK